MASIELQGDANLTLVVDGTFTVTGGKAGDGQDSAAVNPPGGSGGYAGIYVPVGTTLTVRGTGRLAARGGHAGDGGSGFKNEIGAGGGGGAGAGIGGNGGTGGAGGDGTSGSSDIGKPGGTGISAGNIYLYESVTVTAYGGAGGSGGSIPVGATGPAGGGGYPAAGIGGGGAGAGGASHDPGGGGFSGGCADYVTTDKPTWDKVLDGNGAPAGTGAPGGGYFSSYNGDVWDALADIRASLGGGAIKYVNYGGSRGGNGGAAGSGGEVYVGSKASLTAANGSYKTANKQWGVTPTPIYAQSGYDLNLLRTAGVRVVDAFNKDGIRTKDALETKLGAQGKSIIPAGLPGIGSGAGYTETSNGSYLFFFVRKFLTPAVTPFSVILKNQPRNC